LFSVLLVLSAIALARPSYATASAGTGVPLETSTTIYPSLQSTSSTTTYELTSTTTTSMLLTTSSSTSGSPTPTPTEQKTSSAYNNATQSNGPASIEYLVGIVLGAMAVSFCWGLISGSRKAKSRAAIAEKGAQFCINCGTEIAPKSKFCHKCGSAQDG